MSAFRDAAGPLCAIGGIVLLILGISTAVQWYRAGVQMAVYERQGVHMTRWEIFVGAKPVIRQTVPGEQP